MISPEHVIHEAQGIYHGYILPTLLAHPDTCKFFILFRNEFEDCFTINRDDSTENHFIENLIVVVKGFTIFFLKEVYSTTGYVYVSTEYVPYAVGYENGILFQKPLPHGDLLYTTKTGTKQVYVLPFYEVFPPGCDFEQRIVENIEIPGRKGQFILMTLEDLKSFREKIYKK